jgi:hypothetical protein
VEARRADVTLANLRTRMPSAIEGEWLWTLIAGKTGAKQLLDRAKAIADLPANEKQGLKEWVQAVAKLAQLFSDPPPAALLPTDPPNDWGGTRPAMEGVQSLMMVFYEEGFREGLPYQSNGTPTDDARLHVTYEQFTCELRQAHPRDPHPDARGVCVPCGGQLKLPAVDHWVGKGAFPLLAVCHGNLLPICGECNEAPQKRPEARPHPRQLRGLVPPLLAPRQRRPAPALPRSDFHHPDREQRARTLSPGEQPG